MRLRFTLCPLLIALTLPYSADADKNQPPVDYLRDVKPILKAHCWSCHGPEEQESDLRLDTAKAMLEGGNSGPAVVPGKSGESLLLKLITGKDEFRGRMPPEDDAQPLTKDQIALIRRWIDLGAKHPADEKAAIAERPQPTHWSFQPVTRPPLPRVEDRNWARNAIDRFILARLEEQGIKPSATADRATLIRRVSLDLIGLPPSPEEVAEFETDPRPDAYERLVDRLLASPHYGERWGRHWLDQARYADSDGYTNDRPRTMWAYRDWVIDSINCDQPFDRFTIEQLAGDLLPEATKDQIVATGFHRNTQINREGGSDREQYRVEAVVDRVSTTGVVFLGLTLGCARCHDHKYDPVSQREFYEIFAFLNSQDEPTITVAARKLDMQSAKQLGEVRNELSSAAKKLKALEKHFDDIDLSKKGREAHPERRKLTERIKQLKSKEKQIVDAITTQTYVMRERSRPRETYVMLRGNFLKRGKKVSPDVPDFLPPLPERQPVQRRTRLDLARWIVSPENPLTPRVTVNRNWMRLFGRGLVETEDDFGEQGTLPSHPRLLDWLASEFIRQGMSRKSLHRLIVTSATYRQASHARPELAGVDPDNRLLARQNRIRLDAEIIRDAGLTASGLLSRKLKGPSVFPPQPAGVMKMTRNPNRRWNVSPGEDRYRRGMYTYFWRSTPHPFLKLFNAPESNTACTRRDRANNPVQALTLLNDEAFIEMAQGLAVRVLRRPMGDDRARLERLFRICLAREPSKAEHGVLERLLTAERQADAPAKFTKFAPHAWLPEGITDHELAAWTTVARAVLNLDEFITRE